MFFKSSLGLVGPLILWLSLCKQPMSGEAIRPRGVRPELASFYDPGRDFQCLDGSHTIPFSQVNDDYCDCRDGSDEPGTSACPASNFYCPNRGFKPTLVYSSRVNDGICDCCDGSDEWALDSHCPNTCEEMGAAEREEMLRQAKLAEEGLKIKSDLIQRGKDLRQRRIADLETKKVEKEAAFKDREAKKAAKEEAEKPEREALDLIRAEEEKLQQLKKDEQKRETERRALDYFNKMDSDQNGELNKEEVSREIRFDQNNDGLISEDEAAFYLSGHETYNKETFLDIGWPLMSHLFDEAPMAGLDRANDNDLEDYDYDTEKDEIDSVDEQTTTENPVETSTSDNIENEGTGTAYDEQTQLLVDEANAARHLYDEADRIHRDLEREVEDLEKMVNQDFGPDEEFAAMANECFDYTDAEYTYKMCAFDSATQRSKSGGSETRLGNWDKWSGPDSDPYSQMTYNKGSQCWNGPTRSAKVNLKCGSTNVITSVSEPSRCEYLYTFETPAACKEIPNLQQHDEL